MEMELGALREGAAAIPAAASFVAVRSRSRSRVHASMILSNSFSFFFRDCGSEKRGSFASSGIPMIWAKLLNWPSLWISMASQR